MAKHRLGQSSSGDTAQQGLSLDAMSATRAAVIKRIADLELELLDNHAALRALDRIAMPLVPMAASPKPRKVREPRPAPASSDFNETLPEKARTLLARGPLRPGEFCARTGLTRYDMNQLARRGLVVLTGASAGRRVALPDGPAKEEP